MRLFYLYTNLYLRIGYDNNRKLFQVHSKNLCTHQPHEPPLFIFFQKTHPQFKKKKRQTSNKKAPSTHPHSIILKKTNNASFHQQYIIHSKRAIKITLFTQTLYTKRQNSIFIEIERNKEQIKIHNKYNFTF